MVVQHITVAQHITAAEVQLLQNCYSGVLLRCTRAILNPSPALRCSLFFPQSRRSITLIKGDANISKDSVTLKADSKVMKMAIE